MNDDDNIHSIYRYNSDIIDIISCRAKLMVKRESWIYLSSYIKIAQVGEIFFLNRQRKCYMYVSMPWLNWPYFATGVWLSDHWIHDYIEISPPSNCKEFIIRAWRWVCVFYDCTSTMLFGYCSTQCQTVWWNLCCFSCNDEEYWWGLLYNRYHLLAIKALEYRAKRLLEYIVCPSL